MPAGTYFEDQLFFVEWQHALPSPRLDHQQRGGGFVDAIQQLGRQLIWIEEMV
jgi:hypothetical protein